MWFAAISFGLMMGLPRQWSPADARAVGIAAAWLAAVSAGALLCGWLVRRMQRPRLAAALTLLVASTAVFPLVAVRDRYRYAIYQAAGARRGCRADASERA